MSANAMTDSPPSFSSAEDSLLEIVVTHAGKTFTLHLPPQSTVEDIALLCESELQGDVKDKDGESGTQYTVTKLLTSPPVGLINVTKDANTLLSDLISKQATAKKPPQPANQLKLRLMATPTSTINHLREAGETMKKRAERLAELRRRAVPARTTARGVMHTISDSNNSYTFNEIRPLPHLPDPDRALAYLHRLRDDPGIQHAMQTHKFKVGLLTEMDPRLYTEANHEGTSRTLGLNRNKGQVIELRLRTDDFLGYRDYKTVRKTLCHELAHNVHGPHDKHFWALYREIEREVEHVANPQGGRAGGRSLAGGREGDYYEPVSPSDDGHHDHEDDHVDGGGLMGGTYILGSGDARTVIGTTGTSSTPMGERERRARAAEERLRQTTAGGGGADGSDATNNDGSSSSTHQ
ncbi:hypothetical protein Sste5346_008396 [Sporothrix stenoceras]|uniref:WLM domain-containing protein n=1 Tax=Sporothrix stenoceras TaxID=5173 RepID=A0ABR3YQT4_9PEZI